MESNGAKFSGIKEFKRNTLPGSTIYTCTLIVFVLCLIIFINKMLRNIPFRRGCKLWRQQKIVSNRWKYRGNPETNEREYTRAEEPESA